MFQQGLICWHKCLVPLTAKVTESTTHCADSKQGIWGMAFKQWLSLKPFCLQMLWNWSRPELPLFCSPTSTSNASPSHCPGMCWLDLRCWLHSPLIGHWGPTWSRRSIKTGKWCLSTLDFFLEDPTQSPVGHVLWVRAGMSWPLVLSVVLGEQKTQ